MLPAAGEQAAAAFLELFAVFIKRGYGDNRGAEDLAADVGQRETPLLIFLNFTGRCRNDRIYVHLGPSRVDRQPLVVVAGISLIIIVIRVRLHIGDEHSPGQAHLRGGKPDALEFPHDFEHPGSDLAHFLRRVDSSGLEPEDLGGVGLQGNVGGTDLHGVIIVLAGLVCQVICVIQQSGHAPGRLDEYPPAAPFSKDTPLPCTGQGLKSETPVSGISLTVLPSAHPKLKKSKISKWRAAVLIGVYVIMIGHIVHWLVTGMTLSPIEPSETMYSLELGKINAGFIFFVAAILATFVFGRFVCGWGCHIVALQDLCGTMMGKIGIHPKPFRSRLLMWCPLLLAIYMFVVPTVRREILYPLFKSQGWQWWPELGDVVLLDLNGFTTKHLMVKDFWQTFPPWYIVIPFLIVCGFAVVYFLGNKAFCSYGCPYGGFFGVADKFALGKIKVSDKCEGCGHCTAVCTSNVRVHEEVRDYGQVVDPGCMKCLDCVSVCPNGALSFGFGAPNIMAAPRTVEAQVRRQTVKKQYDLSWPQEIVFFIIGLTMFFGFRSIANQIPLLMAAGLAPIGVYFVAKCWELVRHQNVRIGHMQARLKGAIKPAGVASILIAIAFVVISGWGAFVRYNLWRAEMLDGRVDAVFETVFSENYKPDPEMKARAERALRHYAIAGPRVERDGKVEQGAVGWSRVPNEYKRMAWLAAVAGDLNASERWLRIAYGVGTPTADNYTGIVRIMQIQKRPVSEQLEFLRQSIKAQPEMMEVRLALMDLLLKDGQFTTAILEADALAAERKNDGHAQHLAGLVYRAMNRGPQMLVAFSRAVELNPEVSQFHYDLAIALGTGGEMAKAEPELLKAFELDPVNPMLADTLAAFYKDLGHLDRSKEFEQIAAEIRASQPQVPVPAAK